MIVYNYLNIKNIIMAYYDILGVGQLATSIEIAARFRVLALTYHPLKQSAPEGVA
jgi:curved DNA-binding protein CbpA